MVSDPYACGWCGVSKNDHGQKYAALIGWHDWQALTFWQRQDAIEGNRRIHARSLIEREGEDDE